MLQNVTECRCNKLLQNVTECRCLIFEMLWNVEAETT